VWLAGADASLLGSGGFWHDRRRRPVVRLPRTGDITPDAAARLWEWLAGQAAGPPLRRAS